MTYRCITSDSLIKHLTKQDLLFKGDYTIDPYQYCEFGCTYCDSSLENTIMVKTNASTLLENELPTLQKGTIIIGSVNDPYQQAEDTYHITRSLLKTIQHYQFPCHILTKSTRIMQDIDLLSSMDCTVTISILTLDERLAQLFEPQVPSPLNRLNLVQHLSKHTIKTGIAFLPILPHINDQEIEHIISEANNHKAHYLVHKYLELQGEQKQRFLQIIRQHFPSLLQLYTKIYENSIQPDEIYRLRIDKKIKHLCQQQSLPTEI